MNICKLCGKTPIIGFCYCESQYRRFKLHGDPLKGKYVENHNLSSSAEYKIWGAMKDRCNSKKCKAYKHYGERGISICDSWNNSFIAFYEDMGPKPFLKAEIDRIDNDGNYEPTNCHWTTRAENSHNTRANVLNWFTVRSIRRLYRLHKYTTKELALIYALKPRTIESVVYNESWKEKIS